MRLNSIWNALLCTLCCGFSYAADTTNGWPGFRGPTHDNRVAAPIQWPAEGPKQLWKAEVGEGYSSLAIGNGRVYTLGYAAGQDTVYCLDAESGQLIWKQTYPCESDRSFPGPRATPTLDGDKVYTFSRKGHLKCFDAAKGAIIWETNLAQETNGLAPKRDFTSSPVILGSRLFLNIGSNGCAVDKNTGKLVWKSGTDVSGYATPVVYKQTEASPPELAIFSATALNGVNPENGEVLWSLPWATNHGVNAVDPLFSGNKAFVSSAYDFGCAVIQVEGKHGKTLWSSKAMECHISNPVLIKGCLYGFDGNQNSPGALKCLDFETGKVLWSKEPFMGTLLTDGSKLLILNAKGELILAEADPQGFKELNRTQILGGQCWTLPALVDGHLYARNAAGQVVCWKL